MPQLVNSLRIDALLTWMTKMATSLWTMKPVEPLKSTSFVVFQTIHKYPFSLSGLSVRHRTALPVLIHHPAISFKTAQPPALYLGTENRAIAVPLHISITTGPYVTGDLGINVRL